MSRSFPPPIGLAIALAASLASVVGPVEAGEAELARARDAYDRGVRAESRGDHATASRAFADADMLAPSVASLEAALESAMRADDAPLGAELLERAEARVTDAGLAKTLDAAKKRFSGRTGKVRVDCGFASTCLVAVDGTARDAARAVHVGVGAHSVMVERDGVRLDRLVDVRAGEVVLLAPEEKSAPASPNVVPPVAPPRPETPSEKGLSPVWFFVGVGVTTALGGATIASALDTSAKHDDFARDCGASGVGPVPTGCADRASSGAAADTRTNVLLGVTAGLAALTGVTALFVRWSSPRPTEAALPPRRSPRIVPVPWVARNGGGASFSMAWP